MKRKHDVPPVIFATLGHSLRIAACLGLASPLVLAQMAYCSPAQTSTVEAMARPLPRPHRNVQVTFAQANR